MKSEIDVEYQPHLWELPKFKAYLLAMYSVFRPGEWLTIREIHRRLGKGVIQRWTFDALEFGEFETKSFKPTLFRRK